MKRFIALHFLPGAAGNLLSRCINLLDHTYVWSNGKTVPNTLEEKLDLLTYKDVIKYPNWIAFEATVKAYNIAKPHWDIGPDGNGVFVMHPSSVDKIKKTLEGWHENADAITVNIYIDHEDNLDWLILNGWHKYSYQTIHWFDHSIELKNDLSVYKFNLASIINGYNKFLPEFIKLAAFINRTVTKDIEIALHTLYKEWEKTIFQCSEFEKRRASLAEIFRKIAIDFERKKQHDIVEVDTDYKDQLKL